MTTPLDPMTDGRPPDETARVDPDRAPGANPEDDTPAEPAVGSRVVRDEGPPPTRTRWVVGLAVAAVVVAITIAVATLLTGASPSSTVLGYVPEGSSAYAQVRLDLPGDQRQALGAFLSKFPGFADQATLESKLGEVLDDLVRELTDGGQTYTTDIEPWFGGEIAVSVGRPPTAAGLFGGSDADAVRGATLVSIKDAALAQAWFDRMIAGSGAATTSEVHDGTALTVVDEGGSRMAMAIVDGRVAVIGDIASVEGAIDSKGASGFAAAPGPKAALASSTEAAVGFAYLDLRSWIGLANEVGGATTGSPAVDVVGGAMARTIPDWTAAWVRVENDAVVVRSVAPRAETHLGPTENRRSAVIDRVPGSAVAAVTMNDLGASIRQVLDVYRSEPAYEGALGDLDQGLALLGGFDAAIGWAGDAAIVIDAADGAPMGGVVIAPHDAAAAERFFSSVRAFIALGGAQQGVTATDEAYGAATITTIELAGPGGAAGGAGIPLLDGGGRLAYAVTGDVVVIGSGPDFVRRVLDTTAATSLGSNPRYAALAERIGIGTSSTFVDVAAIRTLVEGAAASLADPATIATYESDLKPFILPFDALVAANRVDGDEVQTIVTITVK